MFNLVSGLIFTSVIFCNCSSMSSNKNMKDVELVEFCQTYAKAICTKDTVNFYRLINREKLLVAMNKWIQDGSVLTDDDLFFPFFFVYGSLKIRYQDLINERNKENFFKNFRITNEEILGDGTRKLSITWVQNIPTAEEQQIELTVAKEKEWKVVGAQWKTL